MAGSSFGDDTSVSGTLAIIEENTTPSAPSAGAGGILYTKSDGKIYWISDDLSETDLTSGGGSAADDISTGDAAVTIATSAGNITCDAQGNNTDTIFKGTTGGVDTVFLTLDGGDNTAIFGGGMRVARAAKTTAYTVLVGDYIIQCDPSGAAFTLTLPTVAAAGDGRLYVIKNATSSTNAITIDGSGAETIEDEASIAMTQPYASVTVYCDGSEWWVI